MTKSRHTEKHRSTTHKTKTKHRSEEARKYASVGAAHGKKTRHKRIAKRRRRIRLTRFGKRLAMIALGVLLLVLVVTIACCSNGKGKAGEIALDKPDSEMTPAPIDATPTPALPAATPTLVPTPSPTPRPDYADPTTRIPSDAEKAGAVKGVMTTGNVALRQGPGSTYQKLGKYDVDTKLNVFRFENDYYLVEIVDNGTYGYMAARFIELTTVDVEVEGTVPGTVKANRIAIRSEKGSEKDETRVGYLSGGSAVRIYYGTGDYYYIRAGLTDCYTKKDFIEPGGSVPEM